MLDVELTLIPRWCCRSTGMICWQMVSEAFLKQVRGRQKKKNSFYEQGSSSSLAMTGVVP